MTSLKKTSRRPKSQAVASDRSDTQRIAALTRLVNAALARHLPRKGSGAAGRIWEAMRYCVLSGGKRFRPLLCLGGCEAVNASERRALNVACAIELIHTYSLVHDDLPAMDNAESRRGRPSCHRKFGEGNAILVGDALLTLAFELLGANGTPNSLRIIHTLGQACGTVGLIGGQALDLEAISRRRHASASALREIALQKTAALITASAVAGGLAGGATTAQQRRLELYGRDVGLAFQLIDDIHDGDGLSHALGLSGAKSEAHRLLERSHVTVRPFGRRGETLSALADWLGATV